MAFAQLTYRESLRDTVLCLRAMHGKLHHVGIQTEIAKSTLADANEKRDWRIYCDFAQVLIGQARQLYADDDFGLQLDETVYALDASTIDLCRSVFPWARFRSTKSGIKVHTLLDLRGNIPSFVSITDAKVHDVNILDELFPEPGSMFFHLILPHHIFSLMGLQDFHQCHFQQNPCISETHICGLSISLKEYMSRADPISH